MPLDAIGGRKFVFAVLLLIAGILIEVFGKSGLSATMATFMVSLYAAMAAANTTIAVKHAALNAEGKQQEPEAATANPSPPTTDQSAELVQGMAGTLQQIGGALQQLQQGQARTEQALQVLQQSTSTLQRAVGTALADRS